MGNVKWEPSNPSRDISEEHNIAKDNPGGLAELVALWEKMNIEINQQLF